MKNVLLIGGSGFIGSNIVKQLINGSYNISILGIPKANNSLILASPNIKVHRGKLNQLNLIKKIVIEDSIDTVIHLASTLIPSSTLEDYINEFDEIIKPTIKLLPFFAISKIKFIFFSSGGTIYGVDDSGCFSENDKRKPISYYGQSKLILEDSIMFESRKSKLDFLIFRPSNPYGVGQNIFGKQGLIATSIGHLLNGERIKVWGDGNVVRDYIHIDDLAKGAVKIINSNKNNEVFNLGSGVGHSVNEIITILKKCTNLDFEIEYSEARTIDVPVLVLNVDKFNAIADSSRILLETGISDFFKAEELKSKNR
ncbi:NAD-dependent epimerase/dehydratase family protein [Flavobacterium hercynium]|uniref:NAD-dependent epimerase/dehydratase domain-containing protein n=1 Tax=Flavobacterium hercynium TaxID=387094 RepID=A0A226HDC9_9FLAO|nr:NAD-dependent epimerase/dehydratase family protein [Flavobacterium hercynium]OXA92185.1 hypothetical protein B0A66_10490 [Flavobacterium hercynium]SMP24544.1 UDP-glucose 4-epimerase [Flavobacterium hercynium]